MLDIDLKVDLTPFTLFLTDIERRQMPYASARALSALAIDVQQAERARLREVFTLRREQWADRSIKITHFAKKKEPWARIAISPPGANGADRSNILGKFEDQTQKVPRDGHSIAIPVAESLGRKGTGIIPHRNRPSGLNFRANGGAIQGDRGTFLIRLPNGRGLILQRQGRGRGRRGARAHGSSADTKVLYWLQPRVRITPDLHYVITAERTFDRRWWQRMDEALDAAMRTAR